RPASVTRSMPPLYSMVRSPRKPSASTFPARRAASSAVDRSVWRVAASMLLRLLRQESLGLRAQRLLERGELGEESLVEMADHAAPVDQERGGHHLDVEHPLRHLAVRVEQDGQREPGG